MFINISAGFGRINDAHLQYGTVFSLILVPEAWFRDSEAISHPPDGGQYEKLKPLKNSTIL